MEAKYRTTRTDEGVAFVIAAGAALLMLAVVISAVVVYFIGATLPYAGPPEFGQPPVEPTELVPGVPSGLSGDVAVLTP